jgi:hypothetical protein
MRGTPFNGVNHGVRRHILPGSVSRVGSGTPFRNGYLALTPGVPSAHHNFDGPRKRPAVSSRLVIANVTDGVIVWIIRM